LELFFKSLLLLKTNGFVGEATILLNVGGGAILGGKSGKELLAGQTSSNSTQAIFTNFNACLFISLSLGM
jgi:hypothetical protein